MGIVLGIGIQIVVPDHDVRPALDHHLPMGAFPRQGSFCPVVEAGGPPSRLGMILVNARADESEVELDGLMGNIGEGAIPRHSDQQHDEKAACESRPSPFLPHHPQSGRYDSRRGARNPGTVEQPRSSSPEPSQRSVQAEVDISEPVRIIRYQIGGGGLKGDVPTIGANGGQHASAVPLRAVAGNREANR